MFEKMFNRQPAPKVEAEQEEVEETESNVVEMRAPGIVSDPSTGTPLGTATSVEDARRMIRQAAEDQREAA